MLNDVGVKDHPVYRLVTDVGVVKEYLGNSTDRVFLNGETGEVCSPNYIKDTREEQRKTRSDRSVFLEEPVPVVDLRKFEATTVKQAIEFLKRRQPK